MNQDPDDLRYLFQLSCAQIPLASSPEPRHPSILQLASASSATLLCSHSALVQECVYRLVSSMSFTGVSLKMISFGSFCEHSYCHLRRWSCLNLTELLHNYPESLHHDLHPSFSSTPHLILPCYSGNPNSGSPSSPSFSPASTLRFS